MRALNERSQLRQLAAEFAVMHNALLPRTVWYGETLG
jgi:hypothetical protein